MVSFILTLSSTNCKRNTPMADTLWFFYIMVFPMIRGTHELFESVFSLTERMCRLLGWRVDADGSVVRCDGSFLTREILDEKLKNVEKYHASCHAAFFQQSLGQRDYNQGIDFDAVNAHQICAWLDRELTN